MRRGGHRKDLLRVFQTLPTFETTGAVTVRGSSIHQAPVTSQTTSQDVNVLAPRRQLSRAQEKTAGNFKRISSPQCDGSLGVSLRPGLGQIPVQMLPRRCFPRSLAVKSGDLEESSSPDLQGVGLTHTVEGLTAKTEVSQKRFQPPGGGSQPAFLPTKFRCAAFPSCMNQLLRINLTEREDQQDAHPQPGCCSGTGRCAPASWETVARPLPTGAGRGRGPGCV